MNINTGTTNIKHSTFVSNAQNVGLQRTAMNRTKENDTSLETTDSIKLSITEGPKAGAQTGMAQQQGKTETTAKPQEENLLPAASQETVPQGNCPPPGNIPPETQASLNFDAGTPGSLLSDNTQTRGIDPSAGNTSSNINDMLKKMQDYQQIQHTIQNAFITMMEEEKKHWDAIFKMINENAQQRYVSWQMMNAAIVKNQMAIMAKWSAVLGGYDNK